MKENEVVWGMPTQVVHIIILKPGRWVYVALGSHIRDELFI